MREKLPCLKNLDSKEMLQVKNKTTTMEAVYEYFYANQLVFHNLYCMLWFTIN